jgi:hypothetical protein
MDVHHDQLKRSYIPYQISVTLGSFSTFSFREQLLRNYLNLMFKFPV